MTLRLMKDKNRGYKLQGLLYGVSLDGRRWQIQGGGGGKGGANALPF